MQLPYLVNAPALSALLAVTQAANFARQLRTMVDKLILRYSVGITCPARSAPIGLGASPLQH